MQKNPYPRSVIKNGKNKYWLLALVLGVVLIDECLKYISLIRLPDEGSLVGYKFLTFAIHKNMGIAFDIPFKIEFVILISVILGLLLLEIAYKNISKKPDIAFSSLMIVIGACGNLFDRIYYGFTVDYIIFFGQSAINLSDIIIVLGVVFLLLSSRKPNHRLTIHRD